MYNYHGLQQQLTADLSKYPSEFYSDSSVSEVRAVCLRNSFLKKNEDIDTALPDLAALNLFIKNNDDCRSRTAFLPCAVFDDTIWGHFVTALDNLCYRGPDLSVSSLELFRLGVTGPGASLGARSYNFYAKLFDSPLTYTNEQVLAEYREVASLSPSWLGGEKCRQANFEDLSVRGSVLSFAPKNVSISRTICTEPGLNMFFQLGLGKLLTGLLNQRLGIDLSTQPTLNRQLALLGSITGDYATIDLKSASDTITLNLLEACLPRPILDRVKRYRSPSTLLPDGREIDLWMVSSMGNGYTFPLQTMIFACAVLACYQVMGIKAHDESVGLRAWGVFGDDIIVRREAYDCVVSFLEKLGFTVNEQKSFSQGPFRESCGGDYFRGHSVRGVYLKGLTTVDTFYSSINRVNRWCIESMIPLPKVIGELTSRVPFLPVPLHAGDTDGVKVSFARSGKQCEPHGAVKYDCLVPVPVSFKVSTGIEEGPVTMGKYPFGKLPIGFNPDGLLVSFLGGFVRNGRISLRSKETRFKIRPRLTPHWDSFGAVALDPNNFDESMSRLLTSGLIRLGFFKGSFEVRGVRQVGDFDVSYGLVVEPYTRYQRAA